MIKPHSTVPIARILDTNSDSVVKTLILYMHSIRLHATHTHMMITPVRFVCVQSIGFLKIWRYCFWTLYTNQDCWLQKSSTRMGFEPTRAEPNGLAVHRLNHSATSSWAMEWFQKSNKVKTIFDVKMCDCFDRTFSCSILNTRFQIDLLAQHL